MDGTPITDAGLVQLSGLTNIEELSLEGDEITDAGLRHIAGVSKLKLLNLNNTKVTDEGRDAIWQTLPGLRFVP